MLSSKALQGAAASVGSKILWRCFLCSRLRPRFLSSFEPRSTGSASRRVADMAERDGELRVFMVAGEVSGDSIASRLMASLKKLSPVPVRFAGVGGSLMYKEGLQSLFPMEEIAVMGIWELLPHINKIRIKLKETIEAAVLFRPHVVVTVDSKGFSFRFLKQLKARSNREETPVQVHYVAPSFWAWKGGENRLRGLCNFVDHILCILPFEEEICRLNGLSATYIGHPLLEDALHLNPEFCVASNKWKFHGNGNAFRCRHGVSPVIQLKTFLQHSHSLFKGKKELEGQPLKEPILYQFPSLFLERSSPKFNFKKQGALFWRIKFRPP